MTKQHGERDFEEALGADVRAVAPAVTLGHGGDGAPSTPVGTPNAVPWANLVKAMVFPLFFVVMFALCYVSAFHAPTPHGVDLALVGPPTQTSAVADRLTGGADGSFDVTTSTDLAGTLDRLHRQEIAGVIELGPTVTAHVASGAGATVTQTVESVARPLAEMTGSPLEVNDIAPLGAGDGTGMGVFYFMMICTIGGYLTVTVTSQVAPALRVRHQAGILGAMSVIATLVAFAISSIFVGSYGATAAGLTALALIGIAYTFAVGLVTILCNRLLGQAAIFLVMTFAIFLNFPSAGGAIPTGFLPGFWEALHGFWIGSGATQAMRSVVYFDGTGVGHGLLIVGCWLACAAALLGATLLAQRRRGRTSVAA